VSASTALHELQAREIAARVRTGDLKAVDVVEAAFARVDATEPCVRAYLSMRRDWAYDLAKSIDSRVKSRMPVGPLAGVPIAVKDNICVKFMPCTAASRILEGWAPPYHATVVERLLDADALIIGKTNLDEFAMGSSCESSAFFPTRNPWNPERVPGGSSGGSAAAVAARSAAAGLGSDTGGSIRQPASLCGIVGLKPTYGLVSRYGLLAFASSLDQIGPLGRDVEDAALVLDAIAGHDPMDSTSLPPESRGAAPSGFLAGLDGGTLPEGLRIGIPREYVEAAQDEGVRAAVGRAIETLRSLGARTVDVTLPHTAYGIATYYILATAEASSNLARYDGVHYGRRAAGTRDIVDLYMRSRGEGFGAEVKRRIFLGTFVLSSGYYHAYYLRGQKVRTLIRKDFLDAFASCDAIVGPTSPTTAFALGERTADPLLMYAADVFTVAQNLAGIPSISVPCGLAGGLPVGLQIMGPALADGLILRIARAYEAARGPFPAPPEAAA
jgi:aspartyl-tRNA(Asn)/glutamyl-tRNA(Gln) amidotransferase subunit A